MQVRTSVVAMAVALLSCGGNVTLKTTCVPGQSVACVNVGGCAGGQVCTAEGTAFGPCVCAEGARTDSGSPPPDTQPDLAPPTIDAPSGGQDASPDVPTAPIACTSIGINSLVDVERKFIIPRCGGPVACHQAVFPPRHLHMESMLRTALVGRRGQTFCKNDFYIDVDNPLRSYVLATVTPFGEKVTCPSGGEGGNRMPNSEMGVVGAAGPRLSEAEITCFTWWVVAVAAEARGVRP